MTREIRSKNETLEERAMSVPNKSSIIRNRSGLNRAIHTMSK